MDSAATRLEQQLFANLPDWFAHICMWLYAALSGLESLLGSWGLSIIIMALVVRICMLPLSWFSMRAQTNFQRKHAQVKPRLAELKVRYKGNSAKLNEEILAVYKEVGLRPLDGLAGLLPLMIQLPILIAIYQLLSTSNELIGVSFLWIGDLTAPDALVTWPFSIPWLGSGFNLLPVLMLFAHVTVARDMDASQHASDTAHEHSAKIYIFPLLMFFLFYPFPAGCMLYWTTGSILQVFEQRWCRAAIAKRPAEHADA